MAVSLHTNRSPSTSSPQSEEINRTNPFSKENFNETLAKVNAFAMGVLQGIGIAILIVAVAFLVGVGFTTGSQIAVDIFNRIFAR